MSTLLFIRHGETNLAGRFCGVADPGLNERGRAQAAALAAELASEAIVHLYSSTLRRAWETADAIATLTALPIQSREALGEISFGDWEGRNWQEVQALDPAYAEGWVAGFPNVPAPSGEPYHHFTARVLKEIQFILQQQRGLAAVVTHAGVLRVVLTHLSGCSEADAWAQTKPYCCIVRYSSEPTGENQ